jgi:nucleoside-diphosphate-sugar epimerase
MIALTESDIQNERFILVFENLTFKEVLSKIADALGKKRPKKNIKPWQTSIFWRISSVISFFTGKAPMLSKYSARSSHTISKYSSNKIKEQLSFEFEPIDKVIPEVGQQFLDDLED